MIERQALEEMFENIAEQGQWDMSQPMLWGYFFAHREPRALRAAVPALRDAGYEFVRLSQSEEDDADSEALWWLHVQRVEVHSVDSLFSRNEQLYEFALKHGLDAYDGMDVGPMEKPGRPS